MSSTATAGFPPGTRVALTDPGYEGFHGTVVVCLCKRHVWQPDIADRECGCHGTDATCPRPIHVRWDRVFGQSHESVDGVTRAPDDNSTT